MNKARLVLIGAAVLVIAGATWALWDNKFSPKARQKSFPTPEDAAHALVQAAQNNDTAALLLLFGPEGKAIVSSGNPILDRGRRTAFAERANESMKIQQISSDRDRVIILIGKDEFPFPVPIVRSRRSWRFDSRAGKQELLARRIGSNELDAIDLSRKFVNAEYQFASQDHDGSGVHQYAQRFISRPGKRDGLYWPVSNDDPASPISDLVDEATAEGYDTSGAKPVPFRGYNVRLLTAQGPNAPGGAKDYIVHDLMIGGFGLIAWPVQYGVTGLNTFIVNQAGVVYAKDLGPQTGRKAQSIKAFNPDSSWKVVPK